MTFWPLTNSDFPTDQTFHQFHDLYTELDLHRIMSGFHGAFATGVASQQGTLTLPDTWFRPPFWDLLCSNCWDQIPRTCHVFTRLFTSNTPWYFLDFAPRTGICHGTFEIVPQEVLWSIWGSHQTLWSLPLPNVTWHSGTWPYTMTPSIVQTLHLFANVLPNWTLIPILTLLPNFGGFHGTLQRVRLANRGCLLLRTPGLVPFGTCICSNVETILSWTCHVYGPSEFRTSLGTSILLQSNRLQSF